MLKEKTNIPNNSYKTKNQFVYLYSISKFHNSYLVYFVYFTYFIYFMSDQMSNKIVCRDVRSNVSWLPSMQISTTLAIILTLCAMHLGADSTWRIARRAMVDMMWIPPEVQALTYYSHRSRSWQHFASWLHTARRHIYIYIYI